MPHGFGALKKKAPAWLRTSRAARRRSREPKHMRPMRSVHGVGARIAAPVSATQRCRCWCMHADCDARLAKRYSLCGSCAASLSKALRKFYSFCVPKIKFYSFCRIWTATAWIRDSESLNKWPGIVLLPLSNCRNVASFVTCSTEPLKINKKCHAQLPK